MENEQKKLSEIYMNESLNPSETPRKMHKRNKLRRLAEVDNAIAEGSSKSGGCGKKILKLSLILAITAILVAHYLSHADIATQSLLRDFRNSYRRHYHHIVHGKQDYCSPYLDAAALLKGIRSETGILNQDHALSQLELALRNDSILNSLAFVGPVGVGKSLLARGVEEHFPWKNNVQTYAWNTFVNDEVEKFHVVRMFLQHLTDCGINLLVIDNLTPCESEVVPLVNKLISEMLEENAKSPAGVHQKVIVIYIFTLNAMAPLATYQQQMESLQNLPNTKSINFKAFTDSQLRDCIHRESVMEKVIIDSEEVEEIVATLDVSHSGCKNVNAKVLTHGHVKSTPAADEESKIV